MMKQPLGYALAGVSGFGEYCLEQYRRIDGLKPVAVWNRTAEKAARFAEKHGMRHYETLEELAADPEVDLVHVAAVPSLHAEHSRIALNAGKHVLCEKPLATNLADGRALLDLAEARGVRLTVNFVMRHGPFWETVEAIAREGVLGALLRAEVTNCAGDSGLAADHWFWDESASGGIFIEHGVHFFDLIQSWMPSQETPPVVTGAERFFRPGTEMVDQVHCAVRHSGQSTAAYYHGFHQFDCLDRQHIRLIFERGEIFLTGWVAGSLHLRAALPAAQNARLRELLPEADFKPFREFSGPRRRRGLEEAVDAAVECTLTDPRDSQQLYGAAIHDLMQDFIRSIRDPAHRPRVRMQDALAALEPAVQAQILAEKHSYL